MKKLILIRHAKSSWEEGNLNDFDRSLNNRGTNDAPKMGHRLFMQKIIPDLMVSSNANRAISTAQLIADEVEYSKEQIVKEESIYQASKEQLTQLIEKLPSTAACVFLIGHNPTISSLVEELTSESYGTLPTTGIVGIEFSVDQWIAISKGSGSVFYNDYPKKDS